MNDSTLQQLEAKCNHLSDAQISHLLSSSILSAGSSTSNTSTSSSSSLSNEEENSEESLFIQELLLSTASYTGLSVSVSTEQPMQSTLHNDITDSTSIVSNNNTTESANVPSSLLSAPQQATKVHSLRLASMSGGQNTQIAVALILSLQHVVNAQICVLDEPDANLDIDFTQSLLAVLRLYSTGNILLQDKNHSNVNNNIDSEVDDVHSAVTAINTHISSTQVILTSFHTHLAQQSADVVFKVALSNGHPLVQRFEQRVVSIPTSTASRHSTNQQRKHRQQQRLQQQQQQNEISPHHDMMFNEYQTQTQDDQLSMTQDLINKQNQQFTSIFNKKMESNKNSSTSEMRQRAKTKKLAQFDENSTDDDDDDNTNNNHFGNRQHNDVVNNTDLSDDVLSDIASSVNMSDSDNFNDDIIAASDDE